MNITDFANTDGTTVQLDPPIQPRERAHVFFLSSQRIVDSTNLPEPSSDFAYSDVEVVSCNLRTNNVTVTIDAQTGIALTLPDETGNKSQAEDVIWLDEPDPSQRKNIIEATVRILIEDNGDGSWF